MSAESPLGSSETYFIKPGYQPNLAGNLTFDTESHHYWTPHRLRMSAFYQFHVYDYAARWAQQNKADSAVDVGCGPATKLMRQVAPHCRRAAGVDQPSAIELCRRLYPQGEFAADNLDAPAWPLQGKFDLVICSDVIEHVFNPDILLDYLRRLAAPAALLLLSTPERDLIRGPDNMHCPKHEHVREWNGAEFRQYLTARGLTVADYRLYPEMSFNVSRDYAASLRGALQRGRLSTCQMAVCKLA